MNENTFRKKSLDKIKSPEKLDEYIRVPAPGIWLMITGLIFLMAGALIWGRACQTEGSTLSVIRCGDCDVIFYTSAEAEDVSVNIDLSAFKCD